jgi:hypothetical protein
MRALALAATLVLIGSGSVLAQVPRGPVLEELRQRIMRGATGTVEGRVYLERTKPDAPDQPLVGLGVLLVPQADDLLSQLEGLKRASRDSVQGFRAAAPGVRDLVDEYETELWRAGYPDAAPRTVTDATGTFRLQVPAGAWLLVARRSIFVKTHSPRPVGPPSALALDPLALYSTSQFQHFQPIARLTGFDAVSFWLREVEVTQGETVALDLHDRGVWLSAVEEEHDIARRGRLSRMTKKR